MKLPRSVLDAYNRAIKQCGDSAEVATRKALNAWLDGNPGASIAQIREVAIAIMTEFGMSFGNRAGDAAYALRAMMAEVAGVELPVAAYAYAPDPEYVERTARYQVGKLIDGDRDGFVAQIADASRYFAERGANDTMHNVGIADAKALGRRVRWARVPTGATTCSYCLMLASRGFVYRTEAKALNANHRNCDCRIVEGFDGMQVEGYDPDECYDMWKHPEKYENQANKPMSESAEYYVTVADSLRKKAEKLEDRALKRMERDFEFTKEALSGSKAEYTKIEAFYQGADEQFFKAKMTEARERGIRQAIKDNPAGDNEYFSNAEIEASKKFAESTVELPKEITGRSTTRTPRKADMRGYFNKDGNPINLTAHDGGYGEWKKSWGKTFADKERKRRS